MHTRCLTAALACLAALTASAGNVYKWTDAQGQVHYSQTPPPENARAAAAPKTQSQMQPGVTLTAPPPPAAAPPAAAAAADPKAPPPETKEAKTKRCLESKDRLAFLEERTARRLMIAQPDGSESRMTEEQFEERVAKAKEAGKGC